jgi:large subunit ribosomal protein L13
VKTVTPKVNEADRKWHLIDAEGQILGRLASEVAQILRGKHKPTYTPHLDLGDHVIIINAEKVRISGKKAQQKLYYRHSGYPGALKSKSFARLMNDKSEWIIEHAIKGMLPKNRLGRKMFKKLRVYKGSAHLHQAQQPEVLQLKN